MLSSEILVSAILVLSCTHRHTDSQDDRYTHLTIVGMSNNNDDTAAATITILV